MGGKPLESSIAEGSEADGPAGVTGLVYDDGRAEMTMGVLDTEAEVSIEGASEAVATVIDVAASPFDGGSAEEFEGE